MEKNEIVMPPEWARELKSDMAYWGITKKEIADKIGVSQSLIGMILSGRFVPKGTANGVVKEDIIKAENQIREHRRKVYERMMAKQGGGK